MNYITLALILSTTTLTTISAGAVTDHHKNSNAHAVNNARPLTEPGQGAFAALSELVERLNTNPNTNWNTVNIDSLRDHLVDMNDLILKTEFKTISIENGLKFEFDGTISVNEAALRMVPAHSTILKQETGWDNKIDKENMKVIWSVTSKNDALKIQKLGFYGIMATGDHHREHHLAIGTGKSAH